MGKQPLERITVNLTEQASTSLEQIMELTGSTKTDSVNRSLSVYAYIEKVLANGGTLLVRDADDAVPQKLVIL